METLILPLVLAGKNGNDILLSDGNALRPMAAAECGNIKVVLETQSVSSMGPYLAAVAAVQFCSQRTGLSLEDLLRSRFHAAECFHDSLYEEVKHHVFVYEECRNQVMAEPARRNGLGTKVMNMNNFLLLLKAMTKDRDGRTDHQVI